VVPKKETKGRNFRVEKNAKQKTEGFVAEKWGKEKKRDKERDIVGVFQNSKTVDDKHVYLSSPQLAITIFLEVLPLSEP